MAQQFIRGRGFAVAAAAAVAVTSLLAMSSPAFFATTALTPGNTILGEHAFWNVATFALVETNPMRLAIVVVLLLVLGTAAEAGTLNPSADVAAATAGGAPAGAVMRKLAINAAVSVVVAGLALSFGNTIAYIGDGDLARLYAPLFGAGPLLASVAMAAHQRLGDAAILPAQASWLPYSAMPIMVLALAAVSQYGVHTSRDFIATALATHASWAYLRFFHAADESGAVVGDTREEFEYVSMLPVALRGPVRPLTTVAAALAAAVTPCLKRRAAAGRAAVGAAYSRLGDAASGGGVAAGGMGGGLTPSASGFFVPPVTGGGGASGGMGMGGGMGMPGGVAALPMGVASSALGSRPLAGADPVADRRREKALVSLQNRLAEMRSSMRAGGSPLPPLPVVSLATGGGPSVPASAGRVSSAAAASTPSASTPLLAPSASPASAAFGGDEPSPAATPAAAPAAAGDVSVDVKA